MGGARVAPGRCSTVPDPAHIRPSRGWPDGRARTPEATGTGGQVARASAGSVRRGRASARGTHAARGEGCWSSSRRPMSRGPKKQQIVAGSRVHPPLMAQPALRSREKQQIVAGSRAAGASGQRPGPAAGASGQQPDRSQRAAASPPLSTRACPAAWGRAATPWRPGRGSTGRPSSRR